MSATGRPWTVRVTRSPACTASMTRAVWLRRSRTPISMCDTVALLRRPAGANLARLSIDGIRVLRIELEVDLERDPGLVPEQPDAVLLVLDGVRGGEVVLLQQLADPDLR